MLPKKYRLTFQEFYRNPNFSRKYFLKTFNIAVKANDKKNTRFVVSVPKYLDKRSTRRHSIKRLTLEIVRKHLDKLNKPVDVFIKLKKITTEKDKKEVEQELDRFVSTVL